MGITDVLLLLGGVALFLFGMNTLSAGLEKLAGNKLEKVLKSMTSNPIKGFFLGLAVTAVIQSSSAVTVMLVGLVNSGLMSLGQSIGIIMGTNVGTTVTSWLLSLVGIEETNLFFTLIKPENFSLLFAFIGIILIMTDKNGKKKNIGNILIGFTILIYGMEFMCSSTDKLLEVPGFKSVLTMFTNPILGILVGMAFTAIVQSSSATVGIIQAISLSGSLTFGAAMPIVLGNNIGTCITSLISCIGANKNAKRVAVVHTLFNVAGVAIWSVLFYSLHAVLNLDMLDSAIDPTGVAVIHTVFNIFTSIVLFPFIKVLEKLSTKIVKDTSKKKEDEHTFLDERLLRAPTLAVRECKNITNQMAQMAKEALSDSVKNFDNYDKKLADKVRKLENDIDIYEDKLGSYLVKLSTKELSNADSSEVSKLLHIIGDLERIGDHALNIVEAAEEMRNKKIKFSDDAYLEIKVISMALCEILDITVEAFETNDLALAGKVEPLEQVIDELKASLKNRHIDRLQEGVCTIELGFVFSDLLTNFERVSDHCSNIAVCMIQIAQESFAAHEYLKQIKYSGSESFEEDFKFFSQKYFIGK